jgi:hypothetical protein
MTVMELQETSVQKTANTLKRDESVPGGTQCEQQGKKGRVVGSEQWLDE